MDSILRKDAYRVINNVDISSIAGKEILITGASGLIGTHIICSIISKAQEGYIPQKLYVIIRNDIPKHLSFIESYDWVDIIKGDLTDDSFLNQLPSADYIFHCAGYASPSVFMTDQEKTIKMNTVSLFYLIRKIKNPLTTGKLIYMSSSSVYTGSADTPYKEDSTNIGNTNTTHSRACYIEGKKCGEVICNSFRNKGYDCKSVRLSVTYGPGTKNGDARAMNQFISSALNTNKIELMDSGKAEKAFLYVSDAIELIWKMMLYGKHPIYNLGGKNIISIADMAQIIGRYCNAKVVLGDDDNDKGVSGALLTEMLDMRRAENELGKDTYISMEEGLKRTIEWAMIYRNI